MLTLIDKAFLLKKSTIFSSLDIDLLLTIADKMEVETYKKGTSVFQIGEEANRVYLIAEGIVTIKKNGKRLGDLTLLDFFGDEAVLNEKPRAYDAYNETDTLLLTMTTSHLHAILAECPTICLALLESYATRCDCRTL